MAERGRVARAVRLRWAASILICAVALPVLSCHRNSHATTREVAIGDMRIKLNKPVRFKPRRETFVVRPAETPQFRFAGDLKSVSIVFHEPTRSRRQQEVERALGGAPEPSLYPATSDMTVFRRSPGPFAVVRVNGVTFLNRPLVVQCDLVPFRVVLPRRAPRVERKCSVEQNLTARTVIAIIFFDGRVPANQWPAFFKSLEAGIREIALLPTER